MSDVREKALLAKKTTRILGGLPTALKNEALKRIAEQLISRSDKLISANETDLERGRENGLSASLLDRLALTRKRIEAMAQGVLEVTDLTDPVGETIVEFDRPNGLHITQVRVPIGLIGIIYEARPNVTVDAAALCLKTGNAVLLRGGSAALSTNRAVVDAIHSALPVSGIPQDAVQLVADPSRASVDEMLTLNGILDCVIPRGGASLIRNVVQNATVPVIETGAGVCHTYIAEDAQPSMALSVALNAKVQRPSVCNAMETLIVHRDFAERHLARFAQTFKERGVELRGCVDARALVPWMNAASEDDFATEYNDYILNVKIVSGLDEALDHIAAYGTMHSECIVTENAALARRFLKEVDAAAVYHNASTRFTDGFEFGFGAEIGISTQKLHARGPMGLPALTSAKYIVTGNGQIRE
ncbi:glutamate-5-semialdehyde dehydrogenase [Paenibacillus alkalitolerans]|uniref:glutamate-5-semialdehyde dehydrogenase n=1 Tax=Paenibacillus alkalitolerans TaxID=2799335 RepID=UPI0018F5448D|nr:glutamate-5-semialdehyde dehydrogenase [Paenibacillus alkalitolerans]